MAGLTGKVVTINDIGNGGSQLHTGIARFRVVSINPDQAALKALGFKAEKAPVYMDEKNGRIVKFYVEGLNEKGEKLFLTHQAFFLKNEATQTFIDKFGKLSKDTTKLDKAQRASLKGEAALIMFLKSWLNPPKGSEFSIATLKTAIIPTGDVNELRALLKPYAEAVFVGLAGVQGGKYQTIYSKTERGFVTDYSEIHANLVKDLNQGYQQDTNYGPIDVKMYKPQDFVLRPVAGSGAPAANGAGAAGAKTEEPVLETADTDENPF